jgi:CDGSH-type Zn-finger protein
MTNSKNTVPLEVKIIEDGPIEIKGDFIFINSAGKTSTELNELYICRCGGSKNKPFCDETHKKIKRKY